MNLSIINRSRSEISKAWVKSWVAKLAKKIPELKGYSELSLVFVSSAEMKRLNKQYRGKDYATDVLSFEPVDFMSVDFSAGVPVSISDSRGSGERLKGAGSDSLVSSSRGTANESLWLGSQPKSKAIVKKAALKSSAKKRSMASSKEANARVKRSQKTGALGELVFCLSVIKQQAKVHDMTFEHELGYMIIHGILHLLGYDHENGGAQATKMYKLQDQTFADLIRK